MLDRVAALLGSTVDGFTVAYGGDAELVPCVSSVNGGGGSEHDLEGFAVLDKFIDNGAEVLEYNSGVERVCGRRHRALLGHTTKAQIFTHSQSQR